MPGAGSGHAGRVTAIDAERVAGEMLPETVSDRSAVLPAPPRVVADLTRDLTEAAGAVRSMPSRGSLGSDVTISAYTAVVCTGPTAASALQQAADWCREAPHAAVHSTVIAQVPGPRDDVPEYRLTMHVSFADETGGFTGDTHQEPRR